MKLAQIVDLKTPKSRRNRLIPAAIMADICPRHGNASMQKMQKPKRVQMGARIDATRQ